MMIMSLESHPQRGMYDDVGIPQRGMCDVIYRLNPIETVHNHQNFPVYPTQGFLLSLTDPTPGCDNWW